MEIDSIRVADSAFKRKRLYPDQSVYYFSQLAAAAPYLHDLSGVPAINR